MTGVDPIASGTGFLESFRKILQIMKQMHNRDDIIFRHGMIGPPTGYSRTGGLRPLGTEREGVVRNKGARGSLQPPGTWPSPGRRLKGYDWRPLVTIIHGTLDDKKER